MRKPFIMLAAAVCLATSTPSYAFDLKDALKGLGQSASSDDSGSGQSTLGNILSGLFSKDDLTVADISGVWGYTSPAVSFKSENLLMKAGGAAAAATVESKLEPYYTTAGLNNMTLTIYPDSTFTMQLKRGSLNGTITTEVAKGSEANFVFNFTVLGKVSVGKMETYATLSGKNLSLMFDVTKLVSILQKIAALSGNTTVKGVSSLLDNYDGICAGFKLANKGEAPAQSAKR